MPPKKTIAFQPVILFNVETDADRLAEKLVYSLHNDIVETMDTERSQQTKIGISEIGDPCLKCLARRLSQEYVEYRGPRDGWKAQVGTFGHAGLELHFSEKYGNADRWMTSDFDDNRLPKPTDETPHYHTEATLQLHQYKTLDLDGHCDLYVEGATFGVVDDWKFLGATSLAAKPSQQYIVQMMSYGLAWELRGKLVTHCILYRLPRDGELDEASPVLMRYDRSIAVEALARLERLMDAAEIIGWEQVVAAQPRAGHCFSCERFDRADDEDFFSAFHR